MKRDELKTLGLTDEQIDKIMQIHGTDIQAEQAKTREKTEALATVQESLDKYTGIDIDAMTKEIEDLKKERTAYIFDGKIKDAITKAGGRSVKAIAALLDLEGLKGTEDGQDEAITKAVDEVKAGNAWAFTGTESAQGATTVSTGAEHGDGGAADDVSEVEKLFLAQNPGLKV